MTTKLRAFQITINGMLFMLMSYQFIGLITGLDRWKIGRWWYWTETLALIICVVVLASLVGSTRLNLQILRQSKPRISLPTHIRPQVYFLTLSIAMLYFTLEMESFIGITFDSHLSTHYMNIALPSWAWLMESPIFFGDPGVTIQNFAILFFLLFPFAVTLVIALHNTGLVCDVQSGYHYALSRALLRWHLTLGVITVLFSLFFFFDLFRVGRSFVSELEKDPALLNSSNLASLAIGFIFFLLVLSYGQWLLRDGVKFLNRKVQIFLTL